MKSWAKGHAHGHDGQGWASDVAMTMGNGWAGHKGLKQWATWASLGYMPMGLGRAGH